MVAGVPFIQSALCKDTTESWKGYNTEEQCQMGYDTM